MRILIVDDDSVSRNSLEDLLGCWHCEVRLARDLDEAADSFRAETFPDLQLVSCSALQTDGLESCQELQRHPRWPDVYTILLADASQKNEILRALVAGADDYLIKPFDPCELKIRLRNAMRVLRLQDELDELRRSRQGQPAGAR